MGVESRGIHLTDDQLAESYFLAVNNPHLSGCEQCRERWDELTRLLDHVSDDAALEADAVFTAERLHDQRDRISRRLERQGHPAEVLHFPNRFGSPQAAHRLLLGPARRWVAGAAVAGLVAGVFLGFAVDRRVSTETPARRVTVPTTVGSWQLGAAQDEQMLTEIEDALIGPSRPVIELRALDAMTIPPELQEASFVPR